MFCLLVDKMNSMKYSLLILCLSVALYSCTSIEDPTLERIEDVKINEMSKKRLDMDAHMIIMNPNGFALDLASADMKAYVDNVELATITQTYDTSMPANSEFKMPISITMDLEKLYSKNPMAAIGKGLQIMSERKIEVLFKGTIKAGKGVAKVNVPIEQVELVKF